MTGGYGSGLCVARGEVILVRLFPLPIQGQSVSLCTSMVLRC